MFVRLLKPIDCQPSYLFDAEQLNPWSDAPQIKRTSREHQLASGEVLQVRSVRPLSYKSGHCELYLGGESEQYLIGVPWEALEISDDDPRAKDGHGAEPLYGLFCQQGTPRTGKKSSSSEAS